MLLDTDSGAFVVNALHPGWVTFRSYVYGMLIRFVAVPFHSLRLHPFSFLALAAVGLLCERLATRAGAWRSLSDGTELNTGALNGTLRDLGIKKEDL